jgi:hypothetical protein
LPEQLDIVENLDRASCPAYPYLIILQHGHVEVSTTVVAAPVAFPPTKPVEPRMHPRIDVGGRHYVIFVAQLAAISRRQVGRVVGNADTERYAITRALDMLFTGI